MTTLSASQRNKAIEFLQQQIGKDATAAPSAVMRWLNPILLAAQPGKLTFQYTVRKEWINPAGTLHGGITAAIIDDAIGATLFSLGEDHFYMTLNNVIDYFAPSFEHDTIIVDTALVKKGRQVVNAQCEVWNADRSQLLAKGYSNLIKTTIEKK